MIKGRRYNPMTRTLISSSNFCEERTAISSWLLAFVALLGISLNQASLVYGLNFSVADLISVVLVITLFFRRNFQLSVPWLLFFLVLSASTLFASAFVVPFIFPYSPEPINLINGQIKLLAVYVYFFIGGSLARLRMMRHVLRWYLRTSLLVAGLSWLNLVVNVRAILPTLFVGSMRFRGLMNDPNYFAVLQMAAVAYLWNLEGGYRRNVSSIILVFSVLMSGSKTGMMVLIAFALFKFIDSTVWETKTLPRITIRMISLILAVLGIMVFLIYQDPVLSRLSMYIPAFGRLSLLFSDFAKAVSEGGSGRDRTWAVALELLKLSPIFGVGAGTYTGLTRALWNYGSIAHNTFLQISVEWGLPLSLIFITTLITLVVKVSLKEAYRTSENIMLRDILLVFLVGSLAISLNNARLFWIVFGALAYSVKGSGFDEVTRGM